MKRFLSIDDVTDPVALLNLARELKENPYGQKNLGGNKTMGLVFFNSSLRTRMSTTKAAQNLGMEVLTLDVTSDSWMLEFGEGVKMDADKAEHIKEAAAVMGTYCDILAIRSFPSLVDRDKDYREIVLEAFAKYANVPVINMESATGHPLQALADWMTIEELKQKSRPKVVLSWAPHIKALPQAVPNSFVQWLSLADVDLTITHPRGLELEPKFVGNTRVEYTQKSALEDADFVYVKNWSSYHDYGKVVNDPDWMISSEKLSVTNDANVMHCLPVRRNIVIADDVLDSSRSVVIQQAGNREFAAQAVIKSILDEL